MASTSAARYNLNYNGGTGITVNPSTGGIAFATTSISQFTNDSGYLSTLNGALLASNNLSDLTSTSSARTNLAFTGGTGITVSNALGTIAFSTSSISQFTNDAGYLLSSNNLSDLASTSAARYNLNYNGGTGITVNPSTGGIAFATTSISQFTNDSGYLSTLNGALLASNNLSDLTSTSSARTNLAFTGGTGITVSNALGTIAFSTTSVSQFTNDAGYLLSSNNLSDLASTSAARYNLNYNGGTGITVNPSTGGIAFATTSISQFTNDSGYLSTLNGALLAGNNLSDLTSTSSARTNLAFTGGTGITVNNGAGTIAFSTTSVSQFTNDAGYLLSSNNLSDLASTSAARYNLNYNGGTGITVNPSTGSIAFATTSISQFTNDSGYLSTLNGALLAGNNLSDLTSTSSARTNLAFTGGTGITVNNAARHHRFLHHFRLPVYE